MMLSYDDDTTYERIKAQSFLEAVKDNLPRADEAKDRFEALRHELTAAASAATVARIIKAYCPNGEAVPYETLLELYNRYLWESRGW